ncbi:hypothetical protein FX356_00365 [Salmonella enterica]|uniref:hypothetical protein n=1 Tax=Salmonella enterica TaxID=28901 RepID=UPI0009ABB5BE|nr:hypothetical protein [Salmonella enterica]ECU5972868.1 hypothetical protein [Salmonella enterica subsp. enterica serovar Gaminara]EDW0698227.1 hypothetical protein [Salmonella enterica subsp. enterica]EDW4551147.1 hypothetical protein [Salmonella enterica subsp. salamae]EDW9603616.1 hypothetical protein [Salmonella enterica subsp. houtenae serovar 50:z4,z23:-]EHW0585373.1 hypothetical protein [Salmonella enterica subsp. enterica serovar Minnesota]
MTLEERVENIELTIKVMKCHLGELHLESLKHQAEELEKSAKSMRSRYDSTLEAIKNGSY